MGLILDATNALALDIHDQFGWTTHGYDGRIYSPSATSSRTTVTVGLPSVSVPDANSQPDGGVHGEGLLAVEVYHPERATALNSSENLMRWLNGRSLTDGASFVRITDWGELDAEEVEGYFGVGYTGVRVEASVSLSFAPYYTDEQIFGIVPPSPDAGELELDERPLEVDSRPLRLDG